MKLQIAINLSFIYVRTRTRHNLCTKIKEKKRCRSDLVMQTNKALRENIRGIAFPIIKTLKTKETQSSEYFNQGRTTDSYN